MEACAAVRQEELAADRSGFALAACWNIGWRKAVLVTLIASCDDRWLLRRNRRSRLYSSTVNKMDVAVNAGRSRPPAISGGCA